MSTRPSPAARSVGSKRNLAPSPRSTTPLALFFQFSIRHRRRRRDNWLRSAISPRHARLHRPVGFVFTKVPPPRQMGSKRKNGARWVPTGFEAQNREASFLLLPLFSSRPSHSFFQIATRLSPLAWLRSAIFVSFANTHFPDGFVFTPVPPLPPCPPQLGSKRNSVLRGGAAYPASTMVTSHAVGPSANQ